jgi:hypothetical protein
MILHPIADGLNLDNRAGRCRPRHMHEKAKPFASAFTVQKEQREREKREREERERMLDRSRARGRST